MGKIVILGLDGVPYSVIKELSEKGIMLKTKELIQAGRFYSICSSLPEVSSVAWSSIITGKNPGEHGIYGFTEIDPNTYQLYPCNSYDLKTKPFWEIWPNKRYVIINVPFTYPARPLNGALISGFVAPDLDKATFPGSLVPELKRIGYKIDVDSEKGHKDLEAFIKDVENTLTARIKAYRYFWDNFEWDIFMLVITSTDRLFHFLWEAYKDEKHMYHDFVINYFRKIDALMEEIISRLGNKDMFVMLSDHGFEQLETNFYVNVALQKGGFLKLGNNTRDILPEFYEGTKAFALEPGRIYLHYKSKYKYGEVDESDRKRLIEDITSFLKSFTFNGKTVIKQVFDREKIYTGPYVDRAPDLILLGATGINIRAKFTAKEIYQRDIFTGKHTYENAFLLSYNAPVDKIFSVEDVLSTIIKPYM